MAAMYLEEGLRPPLGKIHYLAFGFTKFCDASPNCVILEF